MGGAPARATTTPLPSPGRGHPRAMDGVAGRHRRLPLERGDGAEGGGGVTLRGPLLALTDWSMRHMNEVLEARAAYDQGKEAAHESAS